MAVNANDAPSKKEDRKMANSKKMLSFALIFALLLQIFTMPCLVSAATKANGLQKIDGKTYYYKQGVMAKNKWVTVNGNTYYFGKSGEAYKGYQKVGKDWYYFDQNSRRVSDKVVKIKGKKYYFMSNGKAPKRAVMIGQKVWKTNAKGQLMKNITSLAKEGKEFQAFRKAAGAPLKTKSTTSCLGPGNDVNYTYDNFEVATYQYQNSQKILGVLAAIY